MLNAAILTAWVISLAWASSRTRSGLCSRSGTFAGVALASAWAACRLRRAASTGTSSQARIALVIRVWLPGAGLRSWSSLRWRAASASARVFLAALTAAAAVFFAGLGTIRAGSSGVTA